MPFATQTNYQRQRAKLKLSLVILLPILFALAFIMLFLAWQSTHSVMKSSIDYQLQETQNNAQSRLESYLSGLDNLLSSLAENPKLANYIIEDKRQDAKAMLSNTLEHNYGEYLDLLVLSRQGKYWANMSSPLYLLGSDLNSTIGDISYFNKWSSVNLTPDPNALTAIIQRYPILSSHTGMVVGSVFGGLILNDNLTLLSLLGKDTSDKSLQLLLDDHPVGPIFKEEKLDSNLINKIITSKQTKGKIEGHYFSRKPLSFGNDKQRLQLLVVADRSLSHLYTYTYLYHFLLLMVLLLLVLATLLLAKYKK
ncbi:LuxQ periplasmic sensor domain-containing protein [Oceanisphaera avium]|nr:LuxQ periplasmic sensor domain-containing protein [Oceanisphaera avium]